MAANIAVLANLAKSTSKPEQVEMDVKQLTNSTTLHWQKPKSGVPSGYYVLARETDSPVWQKEYGQKSFRSGFRFRKITIFLQYKRSVSQGI